MKSLLKLENIQILDRSIIKSHKIPTFVSLSRPETRRYRNKQKS